MANGIRKFICKIIAGWLMDRSIQYLECALFNLTNYPPGSYGNAAGDMQKAMGELLSQMSIAIYRKSA